MPRRLTRTRAKSARAATSATRSSPGSAPLRFDHDLVAFPLLGKHSALAVRRLSCVARISRCRRELRGLPFVAGRSRRRVRRYLRHVPQPPRLARHVLRPRGANRFRADGRACAGDVLDLPRRAGVSPPRARRRAASATAKTIRTAAASAPTARAATAPSRSARFAGGEADAGETRCSQRPRFAALAALTVLGIDHAALPQVSVSSAFDHFTTAFPLEGAHQFAHVRELPRRRSVRRHAGAVRRLPQPRQPRPRDVPAPLATTSRPTIARRAICPSAWVPVVRVDHAETLGTCSGCHNDNRASGKPTDHMPAGEQCDDCHRTSAWSPAVFEHAGITSGCVVCHNGMTATASPRAHSGRQHLRGLPPHDDVLTRHARRSLASARRLLELPQRHHRSRATRGPHPDRQRVRLLPQHDGVGAMSAAALVAGRTPAARVAAVPWRRRARAGRESRDRGGAARAPKRRRDRRRRACRAPSIISTTCRRPGSRSACGSSSAAECVEAVGTGIRSELHEPPRTTVAAIRQVQFDTRDGREATVSVKVSPAQRFTVSQGRARNIVRIELRPPTTQARSSVNRCRLPPPEPAPAARPQADAYAYAPTVATRAATRRAARALRAAARRRRECRANAARSAQRQPGPRRLRQRARRERRRACRSCGSDFSPTSRKRALTRPVCRRLIRTASSSSPASTSRIARPRCRSVQPEPSAAACRSRAGSGTARAADRRAHRGDDRAGRRRHARAATTIRRSASTRACSRIPASRRGATRASA